MLTRGLLEAYDDRHLAPFPALRFQMISSSQLDSGFDKNRQAGNEVLLLEVFTAISGARSSSTFTTQHVS